MYRKYTAGIKSNGHSLCWTRDFDITTQKAIVRWWDLQAMHIWHTFHFLCTLTASRIYLAYGYYQPVAENDKRRLRNKLWVPAAVTEAGVLSCTAYGYDSLLNMTLIFAFSFFFQPLSDDDVLFSPWVGLSPLISVCCKLCLLLHVYVLQSLPPTFCCSPTCLFLTRLNQPGLVSSLFMPIFHFVKDVSATFLISSCSVTLRKPN